MLGSELGKGLGCMLGNELGNGWVLHTGSYLAAHEACKELGKSLGYVLEEHSGHWVGKS
jgi:hypothetical protein